jgi:hypothetical protein
MGLPEAYKLPANYNDAYHITGDGVVVQVVRYLATYIFEPILSLDKFPRERHERTQRKQGSSSA